MRWCSVCGAPITGASVSWSSSSSDVASVSTSGLITALAKGSTTITATAAGSVSAQANVTVTQTPTALARVSGDAQFSMIAQPLALPLTVQVNDPKGRGIAGITVKLA